MAMSIRETLSGRRRVLVALGAGVGAAFVCLGVSPAGSAGGSCGSPAGPAACLGSSDAPFVSSGEARDVASALWNAQERANVTKNAALYDQLDTGSELLERITRSTI